MTLDERFTAYAREWHVNVDEIRATETAQLGFGTRAHQHVVLKVIRKEHSEEWRCGEVLEAFRGEGIIRPIEHAAGAVLLPRLRPGHDLTPLCLEGHDDDATAIIASLIGRMPRVVAVAGGVGPVDRLMQDFGRFREGAAGVIPMDFVDRAETLFAELCTTQRDLRLLHGDCHHYNVLRDQDAGWVVIDPWGVMGEIEFEIGAALRNPVDAPALLDDPRVLERRLQIFETTLNLNPERALKWAFATTVLGILWPNEFQIGLDLRRPFAVAAQTMLRLLE